MIRKSVIIYIVLSLFLTNCEQIVEKKYISIKLFTPNCGINIESVRDSLEKTSNGFPAFYQLILPEKEIGVVVNDRSGEILSTVNTVEFNELDSLKMKLFFRDHGVVLIGDGIIDFKRGELFCVQKIDDNRIHTCFLRPPYDGKGYILEMTYDCIKDIE